MVFRCAVLGSPIEHSLSPVMHRAAYGVLGLDWRYDAYQIDVTALTGFMADLDESWRGLSLTMPLKRAVLPMLDEVSLVARDVSAVNTVTFDGRRRLGDNTDVPGMVAALAERGVGAVQRAAVLGTGATAASAVAALGRLGVTRISVHGRHRDRPAALVSWATSRGIRAQMLPLLTTPDAPVEVLVSTVPAEALTGVEDEMVSQASTVLDVSYSPWPSPLLARATAAGRTTVTGVDLLAHQGALQVRAMTGRDVAVDVLRDAALATLVTN